MIFSPDCIAKTFLIVALLLNLSWAPIAIAGEERPFQLAEEKSLSVKRIVETEFSQEGLHEVSPPAAVQQIRARLAHYKPQLSIESPANGEVLMKGLNEKWPLVLNVKDWPVNDDPEFGLGAHLVIEVDDLPPLRIAKSQEGKIVIPMDGLTPGSHRLVAYLAYPWGEALKEPETSLDWRINFFRKLEGTQPGPGETWLTIPSPSDTSFYEPLLIDSLIWNAPLQGLKEGDDQWRLRVIVNGESFLMDSQEPIWIQGLSPNESIVQFELLDQLGAPINPIFTNKLRVMSISSAEKPMWMGSGLHENQIARLLGETEESESIALSKDELLLSSQSIEESFAKEKDDPSIAKYEFVFPR